MQVYQYVRLNDKDHIDDFLFITVSPMSFRNNPRPTRAEYSYDLANRYVKLYKKRSPLLIREGSIHM